MKELLWNDIPTEDQIVLSILEGAIRLADYYCQYQWVKEASGDWKFVSDIDGNRWENDTTNSFISSRYIPADKIGGKFFLDACRN